MLDSLRRGTANILAKGLLALLVVSFAVWGVADMFTGRRADTTLAWVGSTAITEADYRRGTQDELNSLARQFGPLVGQRLTVDQARQLSKQFGRDFDAQVLAGLVRDAAVNKHVRDLGLGLSDTAVADRIKSDPNFQIFGGTFNKDAFLEVIRSRGLNEARYVELRRADELRDQIYGAIVNAPAPPMELIRAIWRYREELRTVEMVTIDTAKLPAATPPAAARIKEHYEKNKAKYMTVEARKAGVLLLTADHVKKRVAVSDEELKKSFEETKSSFEVPEKRRIHQITFPDAAAAAKAAAEIKGGKSFEDVAKGLDLKDTDYDLGILIKTEMIDPKIADAAFALEKGKTSDVVTGGIASVILRVVDIQPGKTVTFEEVRERIKDRIALEKVKPILLKLHEQIDDERANRKSLKATSEKLDLVYLDLAVIDRNGMTAEGKPAIAIPEGPLLVRTIFDTAVKIERDPVELSNGGFAWVEVFEVTPSRQKTLEAVTEEITNELLEAERARILRQTADKLVEKLNFGGSLAEVAVEFGGTIVPTPPFKRLGTTPGVPAAVQQRAFGLAKGTSDSVVSADGKSRTIIRVLELFAAPDARPDQLEQLKAELGRQLQSDALNAYISGLRDAQGMTVNEAAFKRVTGTAETQ